VKSLLAAIQFLTIVPFKSQNSGKHLPSATAWFPVVGLLLGLALTGINLILGSLSLDTLIVNTALVIMLIIMTGGLHLDGLADTSDAILSGKSREAMLGIMRDPHIGTMGVLSLISAILLKITLLSSIDAPRKIPALILMCVFSRWAMSLLILLFPYARQEGKAMIFIEGKSLRNFAIATAIASIIAVTAMGLNGLTIFAIAALSAYVTGKTISARLGGITGDVLGATNELVEVITLISVCILQKL
jgi:adenosylcobinamide-GDP ribazoletransferase